MPALRHFRVRSFRQVVAAAVALAALGFANAGHAQVYKCTVKGATVYQDAACGTVRETLPTTPATPAITPAATRPARRNPSPMVPEFAPGTVIAPSPPVPPPTRPAPVAARVVSEQTPYIAKPRVRPTGSPREELDRAIAEQQAMYTQRRAEMDAMAERWRSNPGAMDMSGDMAAFERRWQPREDAMKARIEALTDAMFGR